MPITLTAQGIDQITDFTLLTEQSVEKKVEVTDPLVKYDGTLDDDALIFFDPTFTFDFSGIGDLPAGIAVATDGGFTHDAITGGKTLILSLTTGEYDARRNDFSCSGENCPGAADPE